MPNNGIRPAIIAAAAFALAGPVVAAAGEVGDDTDAVLDPGGVAFPWPAPGSWNPQRKTVGGELLAGGDAEGDPRRSGWRTAIWPRRPDPGRPVGKPVHDVLRGEGRGDGSCFRLRMTKDASKTATTRWATTINIEGTAAFRVSGWVRCGPASTESTFLEITFRMRNSEGKPVPGRSAVRTRVPVQAGGQWRPFAVVFAARPRTRRIDLSFAKRGPGELYLDDLSMMQVQRDRDLHPLVRSTGALDGTFAVGSRELYVGGLWLKNESRRKVRNPRIEFDLPRGVELIPPDENTRAGFRTVTSARRTIASFPWTSQVNLLRQDYFIGRSQAFGLFADLDPGREPLQMRLRITGDGYRGPWRSCKLVILPRIEKVTPPTKLHLCGNLPGGLEGWAARGFMAAYVRWGNNAAVCREASASMADQMRAHDLFYYNADWFIRNNHQITHTPWSQRLVPDDARWVGEGGLSGAMCPEYIAQGNITDSMLKRYYRPLLVETDLYQGWLTNWEPNKATGKGCFCHRCRKAFSAFAGLPEQEVLAVEQSKLVGRYGVAWRDYRRELNNRIMRLTMDLMSALATERGKPLSAYLWVGPRPILADHREMAIHPVIRQYKAIGGWWYEGVNIVEGPARPTNHLVVAETTERLTAKVADLTGGEGRYFHCVLGSFSALLTTPEECELDILSSAIARPTVLNVWAWPISYDYRWVTAFANAARTISQHEEIIWDGTKSRQVQLVTRRGSHTGENAKNLWARSFAKDGTTLYALFNFDREHRVFFTLHVDDLKGQWVLHDPVAKRIFIAASDRPRWTAAQLKAGVPLHLGAARSLFLLLEPAEKFTSRLTEYARVDCARIAAEMNVVGMP